MTSHPGSAQKPGDEWISGWRDSAWGRGTLFVFVFTELVVVVGGTRSNWYKIMA